MAVFQLSPSPVQFDENEALAAIARVILAVRLVCCLLLTVWLMLGGGHAGLVVGALLFAVWLLVLQLRWQSLGLALSTHPVLLFLDTMVCLVAAILVSGMGPVVLLLGSGAVLTGLCLGSRGAWVFAPLLVGGWWYVASVDSTFTPESTTMFEILLLVPIVLVGLLALGVGIRAAVLRSAAADRERRIEVRRAGVAEERARLSREMHDSLVKSLHGVSLMAQTLPSWVDRDSARAKEQATMLGQLLDRAAHESRALILAMRRTDATAGVAEQVRESVRRWQVNSDRRGDVDVDGEVMLATESTYELVAILNEALENVERHTPEDVGVDVRLVQDEHWVELSVRDDGPGYPPEVVDAGFVKDGHFGVQGMRERAARVGGRLQITSMQGRGTLIEVRLPAALEEV